VNWKVASGNVWLFGGLGDDSVGTTSGDLNDLGKLQPQRFSEVSVQSRYYFAEQVTCLQRKRAHQFVLAVSNRLTWRINSDKLKRVDRVFASKIRNKSAIFIAWDVRRVMSCLEVEQKQFRGQRSAFSPELY
jgi:hypothetical protein